MSAFFGASVQVVALVIAVVCIISAILGRSYAIGRSGCPHRASCCLARRLQRSVYCCW